MKMLTLLPFLFLVALASETMVEEEPTLEAIDWTKILACLKEAQPLYPEVIKIINAIKAKDFATAMTLAIALFTKGSEVVKKCLDIFKVQEMMLKTNWSGLRRCLISQAKKPQNILNLILFIATGNIAAAMSLLWAVPGACRRYI